jgi:class 3 adenylate cyclase
VGLYMDRHDLPGASPADVAAAHARDVEVSDRFGVHFLSYWFDVPGQAVFCLANAPSADDLQKAHAAAHGLVPNEIISVSEDAVLRFLGGIHEPAAPDEITTPFRAVLITDLVGSTSLLNAVGDARWVDLLAEHDVIIRRAVVAWQGREVKHTGDGILASFDVVGDALHGALEIQAGFEARADAAGPEMRVRIGISAGEPVQRNDDLFGATVNLAARLCQAAAGGQILVSETVRDHPTAVGFDFRQADVGELKGFASGTRVFELTSGPVPG